MNDLDYRAIAKSVLKLALDFDDRMSIPNAARVDAWTSVITGRVWPREAEAAVCEHYSQIPCGVLLPGHVVDFCARQPVWSSREHAADWIQTVGLAYPYSGAIEAYSGIPEPVIDDVDSVPWDQQRTYLVDKLTDWATSRLDELVDAIVAKQFRPWWADQ